MDIRVNAKDYKKLSRLWEKGNLNKEIVTFTQDDKAAVPVIMVKDDEGAIREWTRGMENVKSFMKHGYVKIAKNCPYRHRQCIGEKCQLFQIRNATGDCAHNWTAIALWEGR